MEILDERIVTEVNILGAEVRDSIVDHESVFQHIQDHEGRVSRRFFATTDNPREIPI